MRTIQEKIVLISCLFIPQRIDWIEPACLQSRIQASQKAYNGANNDPIQYPAPGNHEPGFQYDRKKVAYNNTQYNSEQCSQNTDNNCLQQKLAAYHLPF